MKDSSTIDYTSQQFGGEGEGDLGDGLGLSKVHNSAQAVRQSCNPSKTEGRIKDEGTVIAYPQGSMMKIRRGVEFASQVIGGIRGKIKGFSRASRRRLMEKVAQLRRDLIPLFVTLTYPSLYPSGSREYKRHLDNFRRRMVRKFPGCGVIWRLEFQKRGAPHYHLLVWGVSYVELLIWVSKAWYEVVGSGDEKHLRAGTRVEWIRSWRGVWSYVSKYVAKVGDGEDELEVGRWWGYWGELPYSASVFLRVADKDVVQLLRYARRYSGVRSRCWWAFTLFCSPDVWLDKLKIPVAVV